MISVAQCPNDFKHTVLSSLKEELKLYSEFYLVDRRNETFCFEKYENGQIRIIENPWYEGNRLVWSNTYDSMDEQDKHKNPCTMFTYPIRYSVDWEDIRAISTIR